MKDHSEDTKVKVPESSETVFKGYSMDELKYQRALLLIKREFLREKVLKNTKKIKDNIPLLNGQSAFGSITPKGVVGKLIRGLDFADYLMLGFQALRISKKVGSIFRKK